MSQENAEIVRASLDALAAGGVEAMVPYFAADVVIRPFPEWVEENEYHGHDGLRAIVGVWTANFDDFELAIQEVREVGDRVLVLGETTGRIKGSGVPIRQPLGMVWSGFRNGKIGDQRNFLTWQQALEAVGLRE